LVVGGGDDPSHLASEIYFPSSLGNSLLSYQFDGNTAGGLGQRTVVNLNTGSSGSSTSTYGAFARLNQHVVKLVERHLIGDRDRAAVGLSQAEVCAK
jgi:hypothetical protein